MSAPAPASSLPQDLPSLIDRAASVLSGAKTAAEVLEARDLAGLAYDVAKRTSRMQRAKTAHDELVAAAHRAQAHALEIEARAKRRLADEYDAAQARGEVRGDRQRTASSPEAVGVADIGLSHKDIHDARLIRDAEAADPGIVRRTLDDRLAQGEEPTRAALRRAAETRLKRSIDRLRRTEEGLRHIESNKALPLTPEQRARQIAVFGTPEDRAIHERIEEIVERIDEQPEPAEAVRRIPPASRHAIDTTPIRRAAAWLINFSNTFEQEARNG